MLVVALVAAVSLLVAVVAGMLDWFEHHHGLGAVRTGVLVALAAVTAARGW